MITAFLVAATPGIAIRWMWGQFGVIVGLAYYVAMWAAGAFILAQVGAAAPGALSAVGAAVGGVHLSAPRAYTVFPSRPEEMAPAG